MKVRAKVSFVGLGLSVKAGEIIDLPEGADWVRAGLVEPLPEEIETPEDALPPVEHAVVRKQKSK